MRSVAFLICTVGVLLGCSREEKYLQTLKEEGSLILATRIEEQIPLDVTSVLWSRTEPSEVSLYPQVTTRPKSAERPVPSLQVKALYNQQEVGVFLEWADQGEAVVMDIGRFTDAVAVQFPLHYGPESQLPYVGMGEEGHPVGIWYWRASGRTETLVAEGFGTLTSLGLQELQGTGVWKAGKWQVVLKRRLQTQQPDREVQFDPPAASLIPIAFAVWDGNTEQRDGDKALSAWHFLRLTGAKGDPRYAQSLVWNPAVRGDAKIGEQLMFEAGCNSCHTFPGSGVPTEDAPDLTYVGGVHRPAYLAESVLSPSAFIVPDKKFYEVQDGKKLSKMPEFDLAREQSSHIVEYLRTLR
jgi:complex iron-sulfur molybdoenzyme family reductase subunit gamma